MVDDDVLRLDRREAVAAVLPDALREARIVRLELEIAPVEGDELAQLVERQHALDHEHLLAEFELVGDEAAQVLVHGGLDLEADHAAAAAALEGALVEA